MRAYTGLRALSVRLNVPRARLWRASHVRFASTDASKQDTDTRPKTYEEIVNEMTRRSELVRGGPKMRPVIANFRSHAIMPELLKPIGLGDLVLQNLDPAVVLRTPEDPTGSFLLVNQVGLIREVQLNQIDARLMPLVAPRLLLKPGASVYAPDGTAGAPLGITAEGEDAELVDTSLEKPTGKVVSWWVYRLVSAPLREAYVQATIRAHDYLPRVLRSMQKYQSYNSPKVVPFLQFVAETLSAAQTEISVVDFYAVRMCLEHYSLEFKYQLNLSYTSPGAILILPQSTEGRNIGIQASSARDMSFLLDYARNNLPTGVCEARAVELLRAQFPNQQFVDPAVASELLKLPRGGLYESNWTNWIFETAEDSNRAKTLLQHRRKDVLANVRRVYEQPVYCIDGKDAKEVDDGISLEQVSADTYRLGIHIANPSAMFNLKAGLRNILPLTSTVYLHDNKTIPMLPSHIVEPANLIAGLGAKPSLSLFVDYNTSTKHFSNVSIEPLNLTNVVNLTYDEIDKTKQPFSTFYGVAVKLLESRYDEGAFSFQNYVDDDFELLGLKRTPPGETIVSEFMILANKLVAEYCKGANIPVFLRQQYVHLPSPQLETEFENHRASSGGLLGLSWRPLVARSRPSVEPASHSGLGAGLTTRFTSPLRRLEDLITHAQLEAHILGKKLPFTESDLHDLIDWLRVSEYLSSRLMRMDSDIDQFAQLAPGMIVDGIVSTVAKDIHGQSTVFIPQFKVAAAYVGRKTLNIGEKVALRINEVSTAGRFAHAVLASETI